MRFTYFVGAMFSLSAFGAAVVFAGTMLMLYLEVHK